MFSKVTSLRSVIGILMVFSLILAVMPNQTALAKPPDPQPDATYSIGGDIADEYIWYYGPYYEESGDTVSIRITWVPSNSGVKLGLCTSTNSSSCTWTSTITGGAANKSWTISSSGNYYIAIWNKGPETIHFSGYITV